MNMYSKIICFDIKFYFKFIIDEKFFDQMVKEIEERKGNLPETKVEASEVEAEEIKEEEPKE